MSLLAAEQALSSLSAGCSAGTQWQGSSTGTGAGHLETTV